MLKRFRASITDWRRRIPTAIAGYFGIPDTMKKSTVASFSN
jgi:hypothetical protein